MIRNAVLFYFYFKFRIDDMVKERKKLTKDMFEAGEMYQKLKYQLEYKTKKRRKSSSKHKSLKNDEVPKIKSENIPIMDEQNNSVIIWSVSDNIFPKVINIQLYRCTVPILNSIH